MTDTETALLRAIAAHPDEDTPRLVFADYLEEQGTPSGSARAEFIRLHIQVTRLSRTDPDRDGLLRRIDQILCAWDFAWQKEMSAGFRTLSGYRRGFVYRAAANASAVANAADNPRLLLVEELELTLDVSVSRLVELAAQPLFARLQSLTVRGGLLGWAGVKALAEGNHRMLQKLVLSGLGLGDRGLRTLSESHNFPRLRYLDVSFNGVSAGALMEFRATPFYSRLEHVIDWGNAFPV